MNGTTEATQEYRGLRRAAPEPMRPPPPPTDPPRELAVPAAMSRLCAEIEMQRGLILELESRLAPVIRLEPHKDQITAPTPVPPGIAGVIAEQTENISSSNTRLRELLRLLEI